MNALLETSDQLLRRALDAFDSGFDSLHEALEALPAPIYVTDSLGFVTYANAACVGFAGRLPAIGKDRWCVTWKLYTEDGEFLPHDQCPMAQAIAQGTEIRGLCAVAERPDGTRVTFSPLPTPLFDAAGVMVGAVNMLVDVTDARQLTDLQAQAGRCRRLARDTPDARAKDALLEMAGEYEAKVAALQLRLRIV